jgi:opacity protein-like surface antigen
LPGKAGIFGRKGGENNQTPKGERIMIKRLALLCCILLLPTIAAAAYQPGQTNYGEWWAGVHGGGYFGEGRDAGAVAGGIVGYNFCMANRPIWERYFGVALDFTWNQFTLKNSAANGDQFALSLLARLQYPLMGDDTFTTGRFVPFLMFGPAIVWTDQSGGFGNRTDFGVVAETGFEYFIIPKLSIGPSFRYRFVGFSGGEDQFMALGRLAYHF